MDFIEQIFGISPDAGDGSLEVLWGITLAVGVATLLFRGRIAAWLARRRGETRG